MMPRFVLLFFAVALGWVISGDFGLAAEKPQWLSVVGKMDTSHGYYGAVSGEFIVDYYDENLPWGTRVDVHYGFSRGEFRNGQLVQVSSWAEPQTREASAIGPYKWGLKIVKQLYFRGSSSQLTKLDFYLQITFPNGEVQRVPAVSSGRGYFSVRRALDEVGCFPWGERYCALSIDLN